MVAVGDLIEFHIGGGWGEESLDSTHSEPGYVIRGTDIPSVALGDSSRVPFRYHKPSNIKSRTLADGDLIFEVSGGSKGQPVGRTLLVTSELLERFDRPVICASFCKKIRPANRNLSEFLTLNFQFIREIGFMDTFATQSASNITNFRFADFLTQYKLLCPPDSVLTSFNDVVTPIFRQIRLLGRQIQVLGQGRDVLLPRLMNGEVEV